MGYLDVIYGTYFVNKQSLQDVAFGAFFFFFHYFRCGLWCILKVQLWRLLFNMYFILKFEIISPCCIIPEEKKKRILVQKKSEALMDGKETVKGQQYMVIIVEKHYYRCLYFMGCEAMSRTVVCVWVQTFAKTVFSFVMRRCDDYICQEYNI